MTPHCAGLLPEDWVARGQSLEVGRKLLAAAKRGDADRQTVRGLKKTVLAQIAAESVAEPLRISRREVAADGFVKPLRHRRRGWPHPGALRGAGRGPVRLPAQRSPAARAEPR